MANALVPYKPPAHTTLGELALKFEHIRQTYEAVERARAAMIAEKNHVAALEFVKLARRLRELRATLPKPRLVAS
jgi:hypothetical protein